MIKDLFGASLIWLIQSTAKFSIIVINLLQSCLVWLKYNKYLHIIKTAYYNNQFQYRKEKFILKNLDMCRGIISEADAHAVTTHIIGLYEDFLLNNGSVIPKFQTTSKLDDETVEFTKTYSCELDTHQMTDDIRNCLDKLRYSTGELQYSKGAVVEIHVRKKKKTL